MLKLALALLLTLAPVAYGQTATLNQPHPEELLRFLGITTWTLEIPNERFERAEGTLKLYTKEAGRFRVQGGTALNLDFTDEMENAASVRVTVFAQPRAGRIGLSINGHGPATANLPLPRTNQAMAAPLVARGPAGLENEYLLLAGPTLASTSPTPEQLNDLDWFLTLELATR